MTKNKQKRTHTKKTKTKYKGQPESTNPNQMLKDVMMENLLISDE